jgi:hypothetical protein
LDQLPTGTLVGRLSEIEIDELDLMECYPNGGVANLWIIGEDVYVLKHILRLLLTMSTCIHVWVKLGENLNHF